MAFPVLVLVFYAALVVWLVLLGVGYRNGGRGQYDAFCGFGVALTIVLNARYFIEGPSKSIAFFVGIYDVLHNFAATTTVPTNTTHAHYTPQALSPCTSSLPCSVWDDTYFDLHPNWGVTFYDRFHADNAPRFRINLLLTHIFFNTLSFGLLMVQLYFPAASTTNTKSSTKNNKRHRWLGYVTFLSLLLGVSSAVALAMEHGDAVHYGGKLSTLGFIFMAFCVLTTATMGMTSIRYKKDPKAHEIWMWRFAGSMWGSFWLFRVMEFVLGPLLINYSILSIQLCVWTSAPLGIGIAELVRTSRNNVIQPRSPIHAKTA